VAAAGVALFVASTTAANAVPTTTRVSTSSAGKAGNADSGISAVSGNGQFVAFESSANNLVPGDTNGVPDVFVKDRLSGAIERVSVSSSGGQANQASHITKAAISANGQFVVFESVADNLVPGDTNRVSDVFFRDRVAKTTTRMSATATGRQGNRGSFRPAVTDGRYATFSSAASNLVPGDTNGFMDVFLWDRFSHKSVRVSVSGHGAQGNGDSTYGVPAAKGFFVYFESRANNLVLGDTKGLDVFRWHFVGHAVERVSVDSDGKELPDGANGGLSINLSGDQATFVSGGLKPQVYLRYRAAGKTVMVSVNDAGQPSNTGADSPSLRPSGGAVAFVSSGTNLAPGLSKGSQIYMRDLGAGKTTRMSVSNAGVAANGLSVRPAIASSGVAFASTATNLPDRVTRFPRYQIYFRSF
jgi:archaellum component FlaF (FlaF/FlaG flagellin family)